MPVAPLRMWAIAQLGGSLYFLVVLTLGLLIPSTRCVCWQERGGGHAFGQVVAVLRGVDGTMSGWPGRAQ
jgi:hypothetical protein